MKNYLENIDREALRARAEQMLDCVGDARNQAGRWADYAVTRAHGFSLFDFAVFEACCRLACGWGRASRSSSRSSAACCLSHLLRAGCICSGAFSLKTTRNNSRRARAAVRGGRGVCLWRSQPGKIIRR